MKKNKQNDGIYYSTKIGHTNLWGTIITCDVAMSQQCFSGNTKDTEEELVEEDLDNVNSGGEEGQVVDWRRSLHRAS